METNETILTRDVVVIDSHKKIGSVKGLCVDCDSLKVSHYIVNNTGTGSSLVLPLERAIAVGDTFMTVQNLSDFLSTSDPESTKLLQSGYSLLEEDVFSKIGNSLGKVKGYEFDTVFGTVTRIDLENNTSFASDTFEFFTPEFVFVDDGAATAQELRSGARSDVAESGQVAEISEEEVEEQVEAVEESAEVTPVSAKSEDSLSNTEIREFLIGATVNADIESEDGEFKISKGTVLTEELVKEAIDHDALLLLTINVEV